MKIRILVLSLVLLGSIGCARIHYKDGELSYFRLGKQEIKGFVMSKKDKDTLDVKFNEQKGGDGELSKAVLNLTEIMQRAVIR